MVICFINVITENEISVYWIINFTTWFEIIKSMNTCWLELLRYTLSTHLLTFYNLIFIPNYQLNKIRPFYMWNINHRRSIYDIFLSLKISSNHVRAIKTSTCSLTLLHIINNNNCHMTNPSIGIIHSPLNAFSRI